MGMPNPQPRRDVAVFVGRSLAICVHPHAAWRRHARLIAATYFATAFLTVLAGLYLSAAL